jgi:uncharacterized protein YcnI
MKRYSLVVAAALVSLAAVPASAHVSVQPSEAVAETVSRFAVTVPNESDEASTVRVRVEFPPLALVQFEDVGGWERQVEMRKLDEPLHALGNEFPKVVGSVTWSGGEIEPGEFEEFPFTAAMPKGEEMLEFPAVQSYSDGEVVRFGHEDSEEHAASVHTVELDNSAEHGAGQLGLLSSAVHELDEINARIDDLESDGDNGQTHASSSDATEETSGNDDNTAGLPGWLGLGMGAVALVVALVKRRA